MKGLHLLVLIIFTSLVAVQCTDEENDTDTPPNPVSVMTPAQEKAYRDSLNKAIVATQEMEIEGFIRRKQYDMTRTGTGLRYEIYERGEGDSVNSGDIVQLKYELSLLNDVVCYSNMDTTTFSEFMVEQDHVESGLHEAALLMRVGDKARVIMPSARAHGFLGDGDCVPPSSPVAFDLHLITVFKDQR